MKNITKYISSAAFCLVACVAHASGTGLTIEDVLGNAEKMEQSLKSEGELEAFLLASFSIPKASLERLAQDAKDAGIPLVFRGVPSSKDGEDDPKAPLLNPRTLAPFNELIEKGVSVELNPEVFRELGVRDVPVLVIRRPSPRQDQAPSLIRSGKELSQSPQAGSCGDKTDGETALVRGDVTLGYMLDSLASREDSVGEKARALRRLLGGRQ